MTGDTFAEMGHWPPELRASPLLLKPFTLEMLRETIITALERGTSGEQRAGGGSA